MNHTSVAIALFYTHSEAEEAVRELQKAGFDMKKLSVAGKDHSFEEHVVGFYHAGDQMKFWRTQDLFLEKLLGA